MSNDITYGYIRCPYCGERIPKEFSGRHIATHSGKQPRRKPTRKERQNRK